MSEHDEPKSSMPPRDGAMDLSGLSLAQLRDVREHVDAGRFPQNVKNLELEIARRERDGGRRPFAVRFTRSGGVFGWLASVMARTPYYGDGVIVAGESDVLIEGWRRTWLGFAHRAEDAIASSRIRNVYRDREWVSFDVQRHFWWPRHFVMRTAAEAAAAELVSCLPAAQAQWFARESSDIRAFYKLQRAPGHAPWVTSAIVAICVVIFVWQVTRGANWFAPDVATLLAWGANAGTLTVHGEWWRLVASLFLHGNIVHIAINMWVLWSAGRLTERLFGNVSIAVIYLVSGLAGNLLSIAWNPAGLSVGASGAIFGMLGAFIAYLVRGRARIPPPLLWAHLLPTALFTLFSLLNGLGQAGIDNAAHVGGLASGLVLGWGLARSFGRDAVRKDMVQSIPAFGLLLGGLVALILQVTGPASMPAPMEDFMRANVWYRDGVLKNLVLWQDIAGESAAGTLSNFELGVRFAREIVPFWEKTSPRLHRLIDAVPQAQRPAASAFADFADLRLQWARAIAAGAQGGDFQKAIALAPKVDASQARIDWLSLRAQYDHAANSLAASPLFFAVKRVLHFGGYPCVTSPFDEYNPVAPTDSATDGPARRRALRCRAQALFLEDQYPQLEVALEEARRHRADLPDGSSSYEALHDGLDDLLNYGDLSVETAMTHLATWRRLEPHSMEANLAEVSAFVAWAYNARGNGIADTVNAQNMQLFLHRIEIAQAALDAQASALQASSEYYRLAIQVNLLRNGSKEDRGAIFAKSRDRFLHDPGIASSMLHALMPRWGGSFEDVDKFIVDQSNEKPFNEASYERYARYYWDYADQEGEQTDIFQDGYAKPDTMNLGMAVMLKRHPKSDYIFNVAGRFACLTNDRVEYLVFHAAMPRRYSASAWSRRMNVAGCNKKFELKP